MPLDGEGLFVVVYLCFFCRAHTRVYTHTRGSGRYDVDNHSIRSLFICEEVPDRVYKFTATGFDQWGRAVAKKIRAMIARKGYYFDSKRKSFFKTIWKAPIGSHRKIAALRSCCRLCYVLCGGTCTVDH